MRFNTEKENGHESEVLKQYEALILTSGYGKLVIFICIRNTIGGVIPRNVKESKRIERIGKRK